MMVHQGFISFSKCSSRFFSEEPKLFLILHSRVQFFLPYLWRWYYVIFDNLSSFFMIHMLSRMRYFRSTNLVFGVILGYISPKAFPKDCCYNGAHIGSKFFTYPSGDKFFVSLFIPIQFFFREWQVVTS